MIKKFLDASFVLSVQVADDANHSKAVRYWKTIAVDVPPLITTSFVVDEVATYLNSRGAHKTAIDVAGDLMSNEDIECVFVDRELFDNGWMIFQRHKDKRYSLTDCISFALMKQRKMTFALTFDKHFLQAGFSILP